MVCEFRGRVVASALAGPVAAWSLSGLYAGAAALCLVATALILFAYHDPAPAPAAAEAVDRASDANAEAINSKTPIRGEDPRLEAAG